MGKTQRQVRGPERVDDAIEAFVVDGDYTLISTGYSHCIITRKSKVFCTDRITGKGFLAVLAQTKAHIKKRINDGLVTPVESVGPQYGKSINDVGTDIYNIDIHSAYITAALHIGALEPWMYQRLKRCSKKTRLAAIGTLNCKKVIENYANYELFSESVQYPEEKLALAYQWIINRLNTDMHAAARAAGEYYHAYWYDNLLVAKPGIEAARDALHERKYQTRVDMEPNIERFSGLNRVHATPFQRPDLMRKATAILRKKYENVG